MQLLYVDALHTQAYVLHFLKVILDLKTGLILIEKYWSILIAKLWNISKNLKKH